MSLSSIYDLILLTEIHISGRVFQIILENLCLDLGELQAGVLVRKGMVRIIGCKIFASSKSVVKLGVVVLSGGKLIARNTILSGLGTALAIHPTGEVTLEECTFEDCVEGVQVNKFNNFAPTSENVFLF